MEINLPFIPKCMPWYFGNKVCQAQQKNDQIHNQRIVGIPSFGLQQKYFTLM